MIIIMYTMVVIIILSLLLLHVILYTGRGLGRLAGLEPPARCDDNNNNN